MHRKEYMFNANSLPDYYDDGIVKVTMCEADRSDMDGP